MTKLFGREYSRADLIKRTGLMDQVAGVQLGELAEGAGRGIRTAQFRTGTGLAFQVLVDRGMDIYEASYKGIPLAWISPTGPTHPAYFEARELEWLRTFFGGLVVTCGMTTMGAPSLDQGEKLPLHGRVSNLPAANVMTGSYWQGDDYILFAEGQVRETTVFGENLLMKRRIESRMGDNKFSIKDTITNEGFRSTPHMLLYHINAGFPIVDENTRLMAASQQVLPRDEEARGGIKEYSQFSSPVHDYREQVFYHEIKAGQDGYAAVALANEKFNQNQGIGLYVRYRQSELPCFNQWKMMGEGVYTVGLEPATNRVTGRAQERERGALKYLEPGETKEYHVEIGILDGQDEIQRFQKEAAGAAPSG
jgi:hypothetical protein